MKGKRDNEKNLNGNMKNHESVRRKSEKMNKDEIIIEANTTNNDTTWKSTKTKPHRQTHTKKKIERQKE